MRHAGPDTFERLADLLQELRKRTPLTEKSPGCFYFKSKAFLHFHDDPAGIFADVKLDQENFFRLRVSTRTERMVLLRKIDQALAL
jgi:hypothetical protein